MAAPVGASSLLHAAPSQVREAYRKRGWGFNNPQGIAQCAKEGFLTKIKVGCWLRLMTRQMPRASMSIQHAAHAVHRSTCALKWGSSNEHFHLNAWTRR